MVSLGLLGKHLLLQIWPPGTSLWSQLVLAALIADSQVGAGMVTDAEMGKVCQEWNRGLKSRHCLPSQLLLLRGSAASARQVG